MAKDYYKTLGVDKNATADEIKKAFHKAAHKHHPDKNGGDDTAFKEANEAYQVLSDKEKRARYDQFGSADQHAGFGGSSGGYGGGFGFDPSGFGFDFSGGGFGGSQGFDPNDLGDIFGDFFGGGRTRKQSNKGRDYETTISISFKDSLIGVNKKLDITHDIVCLVCDGTGDKHKKQPVTCSTCKGKGVTYGVKQTFIGNIQTQITCTHCHGVGTIPQDPCKDCKGTGVISKKESIDISIPVGILHGQTLEVKDAGDVLRSGKTGSLYIHVSVEKDPIFTRHGNDLFATIHVSLADALLGGKYTLITHEGELIIKIPEGISYGEKLRIKDKGVLYNKYSRGNLYVTVLIDIPKKITKKQRELIEEFKKEL